MPSRPWYTSFTVWLNIISLVLFVLQDADFIALVPDTWETFVAKIVLALNLVLRVFKTNSAITPSFRG
jgi:hypothetical protein